MNDGPLVDVIMCTNRMSPFLAQALATLGAQTYTRWQLIVADDGSGRGEEIERAVRGLPARVVHISPSGPASARNAAIRAGTGEIVTFLDDDDEWPVDRLRLAVDLLEKNPDALGVFGDGVEIDASGAQRGVWRSAPATTEEYLDGRGALPRITTLAVRRKALDDLGLFVDGMYFGEDTELTLRLARHGKLVATNNVMVRYRRHSANATTADWQVQSRGGQQAIALNARAARTAGHLQHAQLLRRNRSRFNRYSAAQGISSALADIRAGRWVRAVRSFIAALILSPVGVLHALRSRTRIALRARSGRMRTK